MISSKNLIVWKLMEKFPFKVTENQSDGITCTICKEIMIDPYNAFCGCQYCYKCITDYLGQENIYCPGGREICVQSILEIEKNVLKDFRASVNILNIIVNCPHLSCTFKCELSNMTDHIRVCPLKPFCCPYASIGCNDCGFVENDDDKSYKMGTFKHSQLMLEAINNLRNDVNDLQNSGREKEIEINHLKESDEMKNEIIDQLKEDNQNKEALIMEMKQELDEVKREMNMLRLNYSKLETEKLMKTEEWIVKCKQTSSNLDYTINKCSEEICEIKSKLMKLIPVVNEDFLWKIENFSEKEGYYYSEPFHKNQYKVRVGVKHGELYLTLYLHVIPGEYDDDVKWPMKYNITMGLINCDALKIFEKWCCSYDSYTYSKSVFDRQTSEINPGIYIGSISIDDITTLNHGLWTNISIILCCSMTSVENID